MCSHDTEDATLAPRNDWANPRNGDGFGANPRGESRGGRNLSPADPSTGQPLPTLEPTGVCADYWTTRQGEALSDAGSEDEEE